MTLSHPQGLPTNYPQHMADARVSTWGTSQRDGAADSPLAASAAHAELRGRILSGQLAGGTILSQVELAAEMGISRTPLREALRMLQEEGLVEAEPNRRCRVAGFDAEDLDTTYGTRLMLEALGMRLTMPTLRQSALDHAASLLDTLEALGGPAAGPEWHDAHHQFHRIFVSGAPEPLLNQIRSYAQRSERYMYQEARSTAPDGNGRAAEHRQILELVAAGHSDRAIIATARHLARTPLLLLADVASHTEPTSIRAALSMIVALEPETDAVKRPSRTQAASTRTAQRDDS